MNTSLLNVRNLVKRGRSPYTRLKGFEPGGDNVVARLPVKNSGEKTTAARPLVKSQGKIVSVIIELETPTAGRIWRGLEKDEIVKDKTVRGLVSACEQHDDAWISLKRDGHRGHSGTVYADLLEAQVIDRHVGPFREAVRKTPGVKQTFVAKS